MRNQDWKLKYQDLKLKFHDAVDVSFRLGFEQGAQNAQMQQVQQQAAAAAQPQPGQDPNAQPGQPGQDPNAQPGQESDGSELDQHISQLESMVKQPGMDSQAQSNLQKSLTGLKSLQFNMKQAAELKKSERAIASIAKSMKSLFSMNKAATKNLPPHAQKALSDQEKIVADLMKSFEDEATQASNAIEKTLNLEQLLKG